MTPIAGSVAAVVAAIGDEADAEIERRRAEADAAAAAAEAERPDEERAPEEATARIAKALDEARRRRAQEDWLDARSALERREEWFRRVCAEGLRLAAERELEAAGARLLDRAAEAIGRVPGDGCVVILPPGAASFADDGWLARLRERCGNRDVRRAVPDGGPASSGCIVRSTDGRFQLDDTLEARSRRREGEWRAALTALYVRG